MASLLAVWLPAAAAYTLLGAHPGRSLRTGGCFAGEKGISGGIHSTGLRAAVALEYPPGRSTS